MRKYLVAVFLLLLALIGVVAKLRPGMEREKADAVASRARPSEIVGGGDEGAGRILKTKASDRDVIPENSTHRPDQLVSFMVGEIEIDGLTLPEALDRLMAAYREACAVSGEVPIELVFIVPPGQDAELRLKIPVMNVHSAVRTLGALAGLDVSRTGKVYTFKRDETRRERTAEIDGANMLWTNLREWTGEEEDDTRDADDILKRLAAMGLELDPQTRLSLTPAGTISVSTPSAADFKAIAALAEVTAGGRIMNRHTFKSVEIAAGTDVKIPPGPLTDAQVQLLMRDLAMVKGTNLMTMPEVTSRAGQQAKVEIIREVSAPGSEPVMVGHVVDVETKPVGFGSSGNIRYRDTDATVDPQKGVMVDVKADLGGEGYSRAGSTQVFVETKPDGSRRVFFATGSRLDLTGRPVPVD